MFELCDVCGARAVDCIGGEVYHCADHADEAIKVYEDYRKVSERYEGEGQP